MTPLERWRRLASTVGHLTPTQIGWRLVHEARQRVYRRAGGLLGPRVAPDGDARVVVAAASPTALPPALRSTVEEWRAGRVRYLDVTGARDDWAAAGRPKLWRYEQQYHRELVALAACATADDDQALAAEVGAWLAAWRIGCPAPRGDAWEPYPVARRLLNGALAAALCPPLAPTLAPLLAAQLRFLRRHLEWHLLGNHLLCDATALVAASAVLEARGAEAIGRAGAAILARELPAQILSDGGYSERTPQYHAVVLFDLLCALALTRLRGRALPAPIVESARRMVAWLAALRRRDGSLPWLNDAAPDATPPLDELFALADGLGLGGGGDGWLRRSFGRPGAVVAPTPAPAAGDLHLPATGLHLCREGAHELVFDCGPLGPREQPGHGHSDTLAYELVWDGVPLVSDSGVTTYEIGVVRDYERSARAHATVTVDDAGPDELWAAFRAGRRGRVVAAGVVTDGALRTLTGRLEAPAGWAHLRRLWYLPGVALVVYDRIERAPPGAELRSRLPLSPSCAATLPRLCAGAAMLDLRVLRGRVASIETGSVGAGFGRRRPRPVLALDFDGAECLYAIAPADAAVSLDGRRLTISHHRHHIETDLP